MNHIKSRDPEALNFIHSLAINGIKFTARELDVLSCMVSGRRGKTIAGFLSIAPKTVETHIRNIMLKLECNSQESIINFIEKSGKLAEVKQHYLGILVKNAFAQHLHEIAALISKVVSTPVSIYSEDVEQSRALSHKLQEHLKSIGIVTTPKINQLPHPAGEEGKTLHIVSEQLFDQFNRPGSPKPIKESKLEKVNAIFLLAGNAREEAALNVQKKIDCVDFREHKNYYLSFLELLTKLLPTVKLEPIVASFKQQQDALQSSDRIARPEKYIERSLQRGSQFDIFVKKYESYLIAMSVGLGALGILFTVIMGNQYITPHKPANTTPVKSIRSDLPLPTEANLLQRSQLLEEIKEKLKGNNGIQTVALVGIGGAGKTTLARSYARQQHNNIVWEVNAETKESLLNSFENLSYTLSRTEEEKKILKNLQEIKNSQEREDKIITFVKEKLKSMSDWLLIYDNFENLASLQKYMPSDSAVWGTGKVILTTRDSNLKNNALIEHSIQIGELNSQEKFSLFTKLMKNDTAEKLTSAQEQLINEFLKEIPPFPLDISLAAYYLKATNISYAGYLKHLKEDNNEFETAQENVLKEASEYTKTRYNIIRISLKQLKDVNKDFSYLMLFICLLDSQNIPRDLLNYYKDAALVDNFILHLKRYSLLTQELCAQSIPTFSLHRSTQSISLATLTKCLELEKNEKIIQSIADSFAKYLAHIVDSDDFAKMRLLLTHGETFLNHHHLLNNNMKNTIKGELGGIYFFLGQYEKAKPYLEENIENLQKYDQENYLALARTTGYLANVDRDLGNYDESIRLLMKSRLLYQKHYPESYGNTAWVLAHLGIVNREAGHYEIAKDHLEQSLVLYQGHFPANYYRIPWTLALLGIVFRELGDYVKGKNYLEQSLAIYKQHYPNNSIRQAWVLAHLGGVHRMLGDTEQAKKLLEKSLKIYKSYFFENHFEVIRAQRFLGEVYTELGDYHKAVDLFEECLNKYERNYDKNHMENARILTSLGKTYLQHDKLEDANIVLERALALLQGKNHPDAYITLEHLANLSLKKSISASNKRDQQEGQRLKNQAAHYLTQAFAIVKANFAPDSPHIVRIRINLEKIR